jgi:hypothetical protein
MDGPFHRRLLARGPARLISATRRTPQPLELGRYSDILDCLLWQSSFFNLSERAGQGFHELDKVGFVLGR